MEGETVGGLESGGKEVVASCEEVVVVNNELENKTRNALKITVSISGVQSASLVSSDKDQIVVTGEGTDSVQLSISIGFKIDCTGMTITNGEEIDASGGTYMDGNQISSGGGGKSH